jgi:hypothetical protein
MKKIILIFGLIISLQSGFASSKGDKPFLCADEASDIGEAIASCDIKCNMIVRELESVVKQPDICGQPGFYCLCSDY